MRSDLTPNQIRTAALDTIALELSTLISRAKTPAHLCRAREAVVGAMYNLAEYQPSLKELSRLTGKRHHSTVIYQLRRYNRDWPPVLRRMWEAAVLARAAAEPPENTRRRADPSVSRTARVPRS